MLCMGEGEVLTGGLHFDTGPMITVEDACAGNSNIGKHTSKIQVYIVKDHTN